MLVLSCDLHDSTFSYLEMKLHIFTRQARLSAMVQASFCCSFIRLRLPSVTGRLKLSTFMKAYRAYVEDGGVSDHCTILLSKINV